MSQCEDSYGTLKRLNFICDVIRQVLPAKILDVGCGVGRVSYSLARQFPDLEFYGVDSDKASIEYAQKHFFVPNLTFSHEINLNGRNQYELIIASEVIEHVEEPIEFLISLRNKLVNQGRLILTLPNGFGPFEFAAATEALVKLAGIYSVLRNLKKLVSPRKNAAPVNAITLAVSPHINFFTYSEITNLLMQTGFEIERYSPRTFLCGFGFDQLVRGKKLLDWNSRIADSLPPYASSDWMFQARTSQRVHNPGPYKRGLFTRIRRCLYEKQYGLC